jgi:hypothetical protein
MFEITWKDASDRRRIEADTKKLKDWLKLRLKNTKIQIKEIKD